MDEWDGWMRCGGVVFLFSFYFIIIIFLYYFFDTN